MENKVAESVIDGHLESLPFLELTAATEWESCSHSSVMHIVGCRPVAFQV